MPCLNGAGFDPRPTKICPGRALATNSGTKLISESGHIFDLDWLLEIFTSDINQQRHDAICRSRSKNNIGRFFKDSV